MASKRDLDRVDMGNLLTSIDQRCQDAIAKLSTDRLRALDSCRGHGFYVKDGGRIFLELEKLGLVSQSLESEYRPWTLTPLGLYIITTYRAKMYGGQLLKPLVFRPCEDQKPTGAEVFSVMACFLVVMTELENLPATAQVLFQADDWMDLQRAVDATEGARRYLQTECDLWDVHVTEMFDDEAGERYLSMSVADADIVGDSLVHTGVLADSALFASLFTVDQDSVESARRYWGLD